MSEQEQVKPSFMQELDEWTESTIITPLAEVGDEPVFDELVEKVKKAIREKVLQSYRNGLKASGTAPRSFKSRRQFSRS